MRRLFAWWRLATAPAAIAVMAGVSLAPMLRAGAGHDTDVESLVFVHDESQHRFSSTSAGDDTLPAGDHCDLCHLTRGPRGSSEATPAWAASAPEASGRARVTVHVCAAESIARPGPARAPPALA